ncbi:hypothetical protein [Bradyrhizobium sp. JYMT SZCCT0428]|uniref:hypothetical protein n=1 Tax=Bradyrhizobium sp. JYMT SZCCT0428 TaxID=2807673 RepID=UPI001BA6203D|nr:hypothetical protein [Bradyrhizobium sp. JYMT SZCCT0428]MBR1155967.1 hypothetical protein [Bradyrhizobium sp. JYMT SZCCT0428]
MRRSLTAGRIHHHRVGTPAGANRLRAEFNPNTFSPRVEGGLCFVTSWAGGVGSHLLRGGLSSPGSICRLMPKPCSQAPTRLLAYGGSELGIRNGAAQADDAALTTASAKMNG